MNEQSEPIQPSKPVKDFVMYNKVKIFKGTPEYEAHLKKQKAWRDQWYKDNPDKLKKIRKDGWHNNKERRKQSMYKWREKNYEDFIEYRRKWGDNNKPRINAERKEAYNDPSTGRRARILHFQRAREARKKELTVGESGVIIEWMERWNALEEVTCYWCLERFHTLQCSHDHIIALDLKGPHCIENLCISCKSCNSSKQNRPLFKWNKRLKQPILEWNGFFL